MIPDFNRLRVFYLVMNAGGVAAAAKQLHVTQSAVSQHLSKLEAEIEIPLFTRLQNRLVPTDAGERLFAVMTPFIRRLDEALGQMSRSREEPFGLLRIGAPVEFGVHYLPGCFVSFRQKYKDVRFDLTLGHPEQLMPKLEQGQLDIAFADLFSTRPEQHSKHGILNFDPVMDEALVLVASSRYHRTVMNRENSFEALGAADYVTYQRSAAALKSWFRYHFKKLPSPFNVAVTVESVQGVKASVEAGLGLGVLPHHLVATEMARREMVQFGSRKKPLSNKISLVRLLDKKPTLAEKKFVEHVKTQLK